MLLLLMRVRLERHRYRRLHCFLQSALDNSELLEPDLRCSGIQRCLPRGGDSIATIVNISELLY